MNTDYEFSDEETSYAEWVKENLSYINQHKQSLGVMKRLYIEGFAAGWQFRKECQAKEWLQK